MINPVYVSRQGLAQRYGAINQSKIRSLPHPYLFLISVTGMLPSSLFLSRRRTITGNVLVHSLIALLLHQQQQHRVHAFHTNYHRLHSTTTRSFSSSTTTTNLEMSKKVLVPIGDDSEEIETTCITDTLTRFGADVTIASVMKDQLLCKMSRGIKVMADVSIEDAAKESWDLVVLPGGMPGAAHLRNSDTLNAILEKQKSEKKLYGAICAAPAVALAAKGHIPAEGARATCFPAPPLREALEKTGAAVVEDEPVVLSDNLVTSQGPGTALAFGLQLGELLYGKEKRDEIAKQLLL